MTTFELFVPGIPKPAGSKRGIALKGKFGFTGRVAVVDACEKSKDWKADVKAFARTAWKGQPLLTGPVVLTLTFYVTRPKWHFGSGKNEGVLKSSAPRLPVVKPDVLKLARAVEDALTGVVWQDDSQITTETLMKRYSATPGVLISLKEEAYDIDRAGLVPQKQEALL